VGQAVNDELSGKTHVTCPGMRKGLERIPSDECAATQTIQMIQELGKALPTADQREQ
jgi:hypothetical protein